MFRWRALGERTCHRSDMPDPPNRIVNFLRLHASARWARVDQVFVGRHDLV